VPSLRSLHLPPIVESVSAVRTGLVLVTGATGNGKSTTIAALLDAANRADRLHIITIEDPIEYVLNPDKSVIVQREVGTDTDSFAAALRSALRQDPDVIMVGEVREHEMADTCLKAAETGHLVVSSLHTTDAQRSVGRFVGMFPHEEQASVRHRLADNLKAVVSQRLVLRQDGNGLIPAVEVLLCTRSVQEAIRDDARSEELFTLMEKAHDVGMQTFDQHLLDMCRQGLISVDTAKSTATRRSEVERALMLG